MPALLDQRVLGLVQQHLDRQRLAAVGHPAAHQTDTSSGSSAALQLGHPSTARPAGLLDHGLDHGRERDGQDRADDAEQRAGDQHRDDRGEARQVDRLPVHDRVDDVVLDLLVDQLDDHHRDRGLGADGQRDERQDHRRDRGPDLRDQVEQAGDHRQHERERQPEDVRRHAGHGGGHERDRDVPDQRRRDRGDRVLEHRAPAGAGLGRREAEQPVGDHRALHQQEERQERQGDQRQHRAEDPARDAEQRRRGLRQPGGEVLERLADLVVRVPRC